MRPHLYFVAIVPGEPIESEVNAFKLDLHSRFGTKAALKSPCHITLLPPFRFRTENENVLLGALHKASENFSPFEIQLKNFNCFSPRVIFIEVVPGKRLQELQEKVRTVFEQAEGMKLKPETRPFHPHMTTGNRDWSENGFDGAWEEYRLKRFEATFTAQKISLLRHEEGKWMIAG